MNLSNDLRTGFFENKHQCLLFVGRFLNASLIIENCEFFPQSHLKEYNK